MFFKSVKNYIYIFNFKRKRNFIEYIIDIYVCKDIFNNKKNLKQIKKL